MGKRIPWGTVIVLLVLASAPLFAAQRGLAVKARLPSGETIQVYDDSWAVVIGINAHQHWPRLESAAQDARDVKALLVDQLGFQDVHVFVLTDQYLLDSYYNLPAPDLSGVHIETHVTKTGVRYSSAKLKASRVRSIHSCTDAGASAMISWSPWVPHRAWSMSP